MTATISHLCSQCERRPVPGPYDLCRPCVEALGEDHGQRATITIVVPLGVDREAMLAAVRDAIEDATPCIVVSTPAGGVAQE